MGTSPRVIVGSSASIRKQLHEAGRKPAMALVFVDDDQRKFFEGVLRTTSEFLPRIKRGRRDEAMEKIVRALLPDAPLSNSALAEARMTAKAQSRILESGDFLPAAEVARLAGFSENNPSTQPNKWKREKRIFAFTFDGRDYYPAFGIDPHRSYRPRPALAKVLKTFGNTKSPWQLAFWFAGMNSFLGAARPQDLLATAPERVIAAAKDEVQGVRHG